MTQSEQESAWTGAFRQVSNSPETVESYQTQMSVLDSLFPPQIKKQSYSLVDWYMKNRENDLILYYAFGFLHPTEREFLYHHMVRWAKGLVEQEKSNLDVSDIRADGTATVYVPRPTVSRFFKDWAQDNFVQHENLLMRLQPAMKIIANLDETLWHEGVRQSPDEWVSAMDELMCQDVYPADEKMCWLWMNKMAAPSKASLFCMDVSQAQNALRKLNLFRINRALGDCRDFAEKPVVTQRMKGQLGRCRVPWISAKILANQKFLEDNHLIKSQPIECIRKMSESEKNEAELLLKQNVVAAFLEDMAQASPSYEWLLKMEGNFEKYFHPILEKIGYPVVKFDTSQFKDKKGNSQHWKIMYVTFKQKKTPVFQRISDSLGK